MPVTQHELDNFHRFASDTIGKEQGDVSFEELLERWHGQHERNETVASIERGLQDAAAGRMKSLSEVDQAIRQQLGFPPRQR